MKRAPSAVCYLAAMLLGACGGRGVQPGPAGEVAIEYAGAGAFRIVVQGLSAAGCSNATESAAGKMGNGLEQAAARGGALSVLVVMKKDLVTSPLPSCPGEGRSDPCREEAFAELALLGAESQRCAVAQVLAGGGTYGDSFVLGNIFTAVIPAALAAPLASRVDVRFVELDTSAAPP